MKIRSLTLLLIAAFLIFGAAKTVHACTNFLITKKASADGSTMISYAADSHVLYGELYHWPAAKHAEGTMLDVYEWDTGEYLGKIKQASETYNVVGNMNEFQVGIGETTYGGLSELAKQPGAIMDYGSLMYIALQRAKTAREAITVMTDLVAEYGYYSLGESFSISDPNEVWIMEMIGKGKGYKGAVWVAMRIPDGYVSGHANQARITTFPLKDFKNCMYAEDVISFAREKGYFNGEDKDFSFSDIYAPVGFGGARFCESRVWSMFRKVNKDMEQYEDYALGHNLKNRMPLWVKPDHKITVQEMFDFMRDHFEGTSMDMTLDIGAGPYGKPYRWRPLTWEVDSVAYCNERAVATQQTGFSFITQSRSWLPDPVGGILWFSVDDASSTVYMPMYCGITKVPYAFARGNGSMMEFTMDAGFWVFNLVSNFTYSRYNLIHPEVEAYQNKLESELINFSSSVDIAAADLYKKNPEQAISFITDFSMNAGNNTVSKWRDFYGYLFARFMDGNVKEKDGDKQNPKLEQPGYGDDWYKKIVEQTGDKLKVHGKAH